MLGRCLNIPQPTLQTSTSGGPWSNIWSSHGGGCTDLGDVCGSMGSHGSAGSPVSLQALKKGHSTPCTQPCWSSAVWNSRDCPLSDYQNSKMDQTRFWGCLSPVLLLESTWQPGMAFALLSSCKECDGRSLCCCLWSVRIPASLQLAAWHRGLGKQWKKKSRINHDGCDRW